jgi:tetratricopeptide (TPR) repeat protein
VPEDSAKRAAKDAITANRYEEAIAILTPVVLERPHGEESVLLARTELRAGLASEALRRVDGILEARPRQLRALLIRALALERLERFEEAEKTLREVLSRRPDMNEAKRCSVRLEVQAERGRIGDLIKRIETCLAAEDLGAARQEAEGLNDFETLVRGSAWADDHVLAKAAHFVFAADIERACLNYDARLIEQSVDCGYLTWPKRIQPHVRGKDVLDVGCRFGGFGTGFLAAGARNYTGLDPAIDLKSLRTKNKRMQTWVEMAMSPEEIMAAVPDIRLLKGKSEDLSIDAKFDTISLHNVTEHLMEIEKVFQGLLPRMCEASELVYLHHSFYCWSGHHMEPRRVSACDPENPKHVQFVDWNHILLDPAAVEDEYFKNHLNRIRLDELKDLTETYFAVDEWQEIDSGAAVLQRLTPEIVEKVSSFDPTLTERDLRVNAVFCVAKPRRAAAA